MQVENSGIFRYLHTIEMIVYFTFGIISYCVLYTEPYKSEIWTCIACISGAHLGACIMSFVIMIRTIESDAMVDYICPSSLVPYLTSIWATVLFFRADAETVAFFKIHRINTWRMLIAEVCLFMTITCCLVGYAVGRLWRRCSTCQSLYSKTAIETPPDTPELSVV